METPICPNCGAPMVVRTAKKGRNAGKQFYGCSRYPACKCIVDIPSTSANNEITNTFDVQIPHRFSARPRLDGYFAHFFQAIATSEDELLSIRQSLYSDYEKRLFSQWRVDFPTPPNQETLSDKEYQLLSVALKILTRGDITLCSPDCEKSFRDYFDIHEGASQDEIFKQTLAFSYIQKQDNYWFDGREKNLEHVFYYDYLVHQFGRDFLRWVCPQVEINCLVNTESSPQLSGRVDFLICHPAHEKVVVEVDGPEHERQHELDALRDAALVNAGYQVIRITADQLESMTGLGLAELESLFTSGENVSMPDMVSNLQYARYINGLRLVHQIQICLVLAIYYGFIPLADFKADKFASDLSDLGIYDKKTATFILTEAISDLNHFLKVLKSIYQIGDEEIQPDIKLSADNYGLFFSFTGSVHSSLPTFMIQGLSLPFGIANTTFEATSAIIDSAKQEDLTYILRYIFRKSEFREGQYEAIVRTLQGKDSIILLPTGSGKSLIFQLASMILPGRTLVVEPIIALMNDQIDNLQRIGITRAVTIKYDPNNRQELVLLQTLLGQGEFLFIYVSPERLQIEEFRQALTTLTSHSPISMVVVDEAHCVSEWGHDFRTSYLNIGRTCRLYCSKEAKIPPLLALTGTASRSVLKDVQRELQITEFDAIITPKSFDRPNLHFSVLYSNSSEKSARLIGYLGQTLPSQLRIPSSALTQVNGPNTYSGLIFCPYVRGDFGVGAVADIIRHTLGIEARIYSGKSPYGYSNSSNDGEWEREKETSARGFKDNAFPLMVCTNAFGMGIDKPNIRYTIHYGLPKSIESFYQEAGRSGRDGKNPTYCTILVSDDDPERTKRLLDPNTTPDQVREIYNSINRHDHDDVLRNLYFHCESFPEIEIAMQHASKVIDLLPNLNKKEKIIIQSHQDSFSNDEKSLHRLLVLGVIIDYTVNYNKREFTVQTSGYTNSEIISKYGEYIASYSEMLCSSEINKANQYIELPAKDFALKMVEILLGFVYNVIEKSRRQALFEVLQLTKLPAQSGQLNDQLIRNRINAYFGATEYSEQIESLLTESTISIDSLAKVIELVRSPNEAASLRGAVSRYLESYPDHPSLLMLRSIAESLTRDSDDEVSIQYFTAGIKSAQERYGVQDDDLIQIIVWGFSVIQKGNKQLARKLSAMLLVQFPLRILARSILQSAINETASPSAWFLLNSISQSIYTIIGE